MLASYDAHTLPAARKVPVDLKVALEQILSELPTLERQAVRLLACRGETVVEVDPYRVLFALSSIIAYLLRSRTHDEQIVIHVQRLNTAIQVSMTGAVQQTTALGELAAVVETTRTQIALGEHAIARMPENAAALLNVSDTLTGVSGSA